MLLRGLTSETSIRGSVGHSDKASVCHSSGSAEVITLRSMSVPHACDQPFAMLLKDARSLALSFSQHSSESL